MWKKYIKNLLALGFGVLAGFLLLEIFLRIYNPFPTRIKGDKIILPANKKYEYQNKHIQGLDPYITHTKNSLGFRGEELPSDFDKRISVIAVGGSTTECFYISDGGDWPYLIRRNLQNDFPDLWVNNAGLDGHSTFGHNILLEDYLVKIKPKYIVFLVGANDVERTDLTGSDSLSLYADGRFSIKKFIVQNSEVANLIHNLKKVLQAKKQHVAHFNFDLKKAETLVSPEEKILEERESQNPYIKGYKNRLGMLINTCRENKIKPVFITQPCLLGFGKDSTTGTDLAKVKLGNRNGETYWRILMIYNQATIQTAQEYNIPVIDLATEMPKQSVYFYDNLHFTKLGSEKVAEIVAKGLKPYIR